MRKDSKEEVLSYLHVGTQLVGDIESESDLCIYGNFVGTINSCKKLIIGATAQVEGDITSPWIAVFGCFTGNIFSSGTVALKDCAKVSGCIKTASIEIEPGAEFNGDCCIERGIACIN